MAFVLSYKDQVCIINMDQFMLIFFSDKFIRYVKSRAAHRNR